MNPTMTDKRNSLPQRNCWQTRQLKWWKPRRYPFATSTDHFPSLDKFAFLLCRAQRVILMIRLNSNVWNKPQKIFDRRPIQPHKMHFVKNWCINSNRPRGKLQPPPLRLLPQHILPISTIQIKRVNKRLRHRARWVAASTETFRQTILSSGITSWFSVAC